jgi:hypothetical protein
MRLFLQILIGLLVDAEKAADARVWFLKNQSAFLQMNFLPWFDKSIF